MALKPRGGGEADRQRALDAGLAPHLGQHAAGLAPFDACTCQSTGTRPIARSVIFDVVDERNVPDGGEQRDADRHAGRGGEQASAPAREQAPQPGQRDHAGSLFGIDEAAAVHLPALLAAAPPPSGRAWRPPAPRPRARGRREQRAHHLRRRWRGRAGRSARRRGAAAAGRPAHARRPRAAPARRRSPRGACRPASARSSRSRPPRRDRAPRPRRRRRGSAAGRRSRARSSGGSRLGALEHHRDRARPQRRAIADRGPATPSRRSGRRGPPSGGAGWTCPSRTGRRARCASPRRTPRQSVGWSATVADGARAVGAGGAARSATSGSPLTPPPARRAAGSRGRSAAATSGLCVTTQHGGAALGAARAADRARGRRCRSSSSPVGSSASSTSGRLASATARPARASSPPDSWAGRAPARWATPSQRRARSSRQCVAGVRARRAAGRARRCRDAQVAEQVGLLEQHADVPRAQRARAPPRSAATAARPRPRPCRRRARRARPGRPAASTCPSRTGRSRRPARPARASSETPWRASVSSSPAWKNRYRLRASSTGAHADHRTESVTIRHGSTLSAPFGPDSVSTPPCRCGRRRSARPRPCTPCR